MLISKPKNVLFTIFKAHALKIQFGPTVPPCPPTWLTSYVHDYKKLINIFVITRKWKQPVEIHITLQNINMHRSPILFKLDLVVSMNKTIYDVQFDVF